MSLLLKPTLQPTLSEAMKAAQEAAKNGLPQYVLRDNSLNGTFYLKSQNKIDFNGRYGVKIKGNFAMLKKNEEFRLEHGDIIALTTVKPKRDELVFGFQFLLE